jgi:phosphatidylglycerophosphate synthase
MTQDLSAGNDPRDMIPELIRQVREARCIPLGLARALFTGFRNGLRLSATLPLLRRSFLRSMAVLAVVLAGQGVVVALAASSIAVVLPLALLAAWYGVGGLMAYSQLGLVRNREGQLRQRFGLANTLTLYRFLSIPFLVTLIPFFPTDSNLLHLGIVLFVLAAATDAADGTYARLTGKVTEFGRIYDPVCDIAVNAGVCIGAYVAGYLPLWYVLVAEVRFLLPLLGGAWLYLHGIPYRVRPTLWGKATVFVYAVFLGLLFLQQVVRNATIDAVTDKLLWVSGALLALNLVVLVDLGMSIARTRGSASGQETP